MFGRTPFEGWPPLKILLAKLQYDLPDLCVETGKTPSRLFLRFVEQCVIKDPMRRPSASSLLEDPFIKQARNAHYIELQLLRKMVKTYGIQYYNYYYRLTI